MTWIDTRRRRVLLAGALAGIATIGAAGRVAAHPLGNFTINQYSGLTVHHDRVDVRYVIDMAEIPTQQALGGLGTDQEHLLGADAARAYAASECGRLVGGLTLEVDANPVPLKVVGAALSFPLGAAGLHTLRLVCGITSANQSPTGHTLRYASRNYDDRTAGWREITVTSDDVSLRASTVPVASVSAELRKYPSDLLSSPLDLRTASAQVVAGAGAGARPDPSTPDATALRGIDALTARFTDLVSQSNLTLTFAALALLAAILLGAIHAFAPGHGKTIMAAYLIGKQGNLRAAAVIGLSVTATHTIGVLALGLALSISATFAPERLYPILGLVSGVLVLGIGASLLTRAVRQRRRQASASRDHLTAHHRHPHEPGYRHHHHDHADAVGGAHSREDVGSRVRMQGKRSLLALGFVGGMVPSPSALVVLIGAIALHRAWFGVLLVVAYGVGMALALTGTGWLLQRMRVGLERRLSTADGGPRRARAHAHVLGLLPLMTAAVIVVVGLGLTLRGAAAL